MKILQINAVYGVGSTGVIVKDIHELSLANQIDSYIAYSTSPIPEEKIKNGYKIGSTYGKKMHALFCRINGMQAYFSRYATSKLIKYIDKLKPDIVQLHNLHSNYIHLNMLLAFLAKKNIKTVVTLHDCWFYTGGCFHYTQVGCDKWLKNCGSCPKKKADNKAILFDRSAKILKDRKKYFGAIKNLTVVGVSEWIASEAKRTFFKEKSVVAIHNGVDSDIFKPTESDLRKLYNLENKFIILGPASKFLLPVNKETLLNVTSSLSEDEVLVLIGCTDEQKKLLPQNVIALPYIKDRLELCRIYSMADVFANCTREDTFPTVNLEVQMCGTPVVTYKNTGAKETVDDRCGYTAESGNSKDMINKIRYVKSIGKDALSEKCRHQALEKFEKEENYKKYIELFKKIMEGHV